MYGDSSLVVIGESSFNIGLYFIHYDLQYSLFQSLSPVVWEIRIQPTFALVHVVRVDLSRDMNCPMHLLIECWVFLHSVGRISLDSWALGCPGSGNILFHRRMSFFFFLKNQRHP